MARNFNNSDSDRVNLGNVFSFDKDVPWTVVCFARYENLTVDERAVISKLEPGDSTNWQFEILTKNTAPHKLVVYGSNFDIIITGGTTIAVDTWYLVGLVSTGGGTTDDYELFALGMDGTVLENSVKGTPDPDSSNNAADVVIGGRMTSGDNHDGDVAHAACFDEQWVLQDFKDYLHSPARTAARHAANTIFYLPLIGVSPEPDFSPNTNTGTVAGTTISNGPPIGPLFGYGTDRGFTVAAVGGANPHNPLGHPLYGPLAGPVAA